MTDITILGAGIFGLSIAWACQKKGARVRVIDPGGPGAGASGGIVGALAPHTPDNWNDKKAFQFESLLMARAFWAEVEAASGLSAGYARIGRLQPIDTERALELSQGRIEKAAEFWQGQAVWNVLEAKSAPFDAAFLPATPTGFLAHDTLSARVHPRRACAALAAAIISQGGEVVTEGHFAGKVVHATGVAGLADLSAGLGKQAGNGVKGQGALVNLSATTMPQISAEGLHIVPHADGTTAIGSTSETTFSDPYSTDQLLEDVIARARRVLPALEGAEVIERWAGLRPRPATRARSPILGEHPVHDGQFIANGGFKIGFGMAPKVGEVMADLMLDGHDRVPQIFRPEALL